ncbi:MAG: 4Fe-4S binding protein [Planctomycetaceae bacterium]|nr:4Fe-4S binding protein [Planctomycetaceae bacterium]
MSAVVDKEKCTGCGECVLSCPLDSLTLDEEDGKAAVDSDICGECGACIDVCPAGAISL